MPIDILELDFQPVNPASTHREPVTGLAAAPPQSGWWLAGDILYSTNPSPNSPSGWICTATGSPGLWTTLPETVS
jgi:hypothetical protein